MLGRGVTPIRSLAQVAEVAMAGGVGNAGAVVRDGDHVLRPSNPHTATIHAFLRFLRAEGFTAASNPIGIEPDGRERLEYIAGDVAVPPYPAWAQTDMALGTAAALIRRLHDVSARYVPPSDATWSTEMADPLGGPVICHNDVCLENLVYRDQVAIGLLDFDFAAPGRPIHDLAAFARMNVPMDTDDDAILLGRTPPFAPFRRLRVVADAYGLPPDRNAFLDAVAEGVARGGQFLQRRLDEGNDSFIQMVAESGGMAKFDRRREWFAANRQRFADSLG
jgi:aminoglycoside phosphotransferase (APT) family kinase protein